MSEVSMASLSQRDSETLSRNYWGIKGGTPAPCAGCGLVTVTRSFGEDKAKICIDCARLNPERTARILEEISVTRGCMPYPGSVFWNQGQD